MKNYVYALSQGQYAPCDLPYERLTQNKKDKNMPLYTIETKNKEHYRTIMTCLVALGYKFHGTQTDVDSITERFSSYPWITINTQGKYLSGNARQVTGYIPTTLDIFALLCSEKPFEERIKLNDEYVAVVTKKDVTVGCQVFPFDIIETLYNVIQKAKEAKE